MEKNLTGTLLFSRNGYLTAQGGAPIGQWKKGDRWAIQGMLWCEFL